MALEISACTWISFPYTGIRSFSLLLLLFMTSQWATNKFFENKNKMQWKDFSLVITQGWQNTRRWRGPLPESAIHQIPPFLSLLPIWEIYINLYCTPAWWAWPVDAFRCGCCPSLVAHLLFCGCFCSLLGAFVNVFDDLYDLISLQLLIYFSVFYVIYVTARFTIAPTNGMAHLMATVKREKERVREEDCEQNQRGNLIEKFFTSNFYLLFFLIRASSCAFLKLFSFSSFSYPPLSFSFSFLSWGSRC